MTPNPDSKKQTKARKGWEIPTYLLLGMLFGILLIKSEVASWYRIQEMFRFQGFHMYGVLGSAVLTAGMLFGILKKFQKRAVNGQDIHLSAKRWDATARHRYWLGGLLFGLGWGLTGACPGPIFALIGHGTIGAVVVLLSALLGTRVYASWADRLQH